LRGIRLGIVALVAACAQVGGDATDSDASGTSDDPAGESDPTDSPFDTEPVVTTPSCPGVVPPPSAASAHAVAFELLPLLDRQVDCAIVEDLDGDGHVDFLTLRNGEVAGGVAVDVWYGTATPRTFDAVTIDVPGATAPDTACTARDLDHDGDLDVLYAVTGGAAALLADGRSFADGGSMLRIPRTAPNPNGLVLWLATLDLDGRGALDVVAAVQGRTAGSDECGDEVLPGSTPQPSDLVSGSLHCFVATNEGRFVRAPDGVCPDPVLPTTMLAPHVGAVLDLDDDGDGDLISANDFGTNHVLLRDGRGLVLREGTGLEVYNHAMGIGVGDFDADGTTDLYVADVDGDSTYLGDGCLSWADAGMLVGSMQANAGAVNWGTQATDVDADGALDLVVVTSVRADGGLSGTVCDIDAHGWPLPPLEVLVNSGTGRFTKTEVPIGTGHGIWRPSSLVRGDLDGDLDDDFVVSVDGATWIAWNTSVRASPVLRVRVLDEAGLPVVGARVTTSVPEGGRVHDLWPSTAWQGHGELAASFAFGASDGPATVDVRWPDGHVTTHGPYAGDQLVTIRP
jgi:hypothetical protein